MNTKKFLLVSILLLGIASCKVNPFTGQKVLNFYPNSQIFPMAFAQYDEFIGQNDVLENNTEAKMITRVGC